MLAMTMVSGQQTLSARTPFILSCITNPLHGDWYMYFYSLPSLVSSSRRALAEFVGPLSYGPTVQEMTVIPSCWFQMPTWAAYTGGRVFLLIFLKILLDSPVLRIMPYKQPMDRCAALASLLNLVIMIMRFPPYKNFRQYTSQEYSMNVWRTFQGGSWGCSQTLI